MREREEGSIYIKSFMDKNSISFLEFPNILINNISSSF